MDSLIIAAARALAMGDPLSAPWIERDHPVARVDPNTGRVLATIPAHGGGDSALA
jgi:hypothetical protein